MTNFSTLTITKKANQIPFPQQTQNIQVSLKKSPTKKDIFFKGQHKNTTNQALHLMEQGESAGNVLILFLKNSEFEHAVKTSILHGLEGTVPFVNLAAKTPALIHGINNFRTENYRKNLKNNMERFFKDPNSRTLSAWQSAEWKESWDFLTPAYDMYKESVKDFHQASDYILGRPAPGCLDQEDLKNAIRRKNTALGVMFFFRDPRFTIKAPSAYETKSLHHFGDDMLNHPDRFDVMTALKIADIYKGGFTPDEMANFYFSLTLCIKDYYKDKKTQQNLERLILTKIKEDVAKGYVNTEKLHFVNDKLTELS